MFYWSRSAEDSQTKTAAISAEYYIFRFSHSVQNIEVFVFLFFVPIFFSEFSLFS